MKTYQLILAAALVAITGCNKSNVENNVNADSNEIGFRAVASMNTKANGAIISGTEYDHTNTFQVWGWQSQAADFSEFETGDASNFMSNLTISWTGGRDSRDEAWRNAANYYYWPFTGKISFLALHPSTIVAGLLAGETPALTVGWNETNDKPQAAIANYTITPGTNETIDLMFATNEGSRQAEPLNMVFKHALSQIEVQVKTNEDYSDDVAFDVESVQFNNIDLSGNVAYVNNTINWSGNEAQTQNWVYYGTVLEDITNEYQVYGAAKVIIPQPANFKGSALDPEHEKYNVEDNSQATITIGYSMEQTGSAKITGTVTIADPFLSNVENAWEAGKKYNYTLNFRLNEILFDPEAQGWVGVNVSTINIY